MARKRSARSSGGTATRSARPASQPGWFAWFAQETAWLAGRPAVFVAVLVLLVAWLALGALLGYPSLWFQLLATFASVVTLLMVLLIQNTQNRDTLALQTKLSELVLHVRDAPRELADAEDMSDEELEALHKQYQRRAHAVHKARSRKSRKK